MLTFLYEFIPSLRPVLETLGVLLLDIAPLLYQQYQLVRQLVTIVHPLDRPLELPDLPEAPVALVEPILLAVGRHCVFGVRDLEVSFQVLRLAINLNLKGMSRKENGKSH